MLELLLPRPDNPIVDCLVKDLRASFLLFALINASLSLALIVDLCLGVLKAKLAGQKIQSFKARKSAVKMISYYGSLLMCFLCDLMFISHDICDRPYMAMLTGACFILIEIKSWFERLEDKEKARLEANTRIVAKALGSLGSKVNASELLSQLTDETDGAGDKPKGSDNAGANNVGANDVGG